MDGIKSVSRGRNVYGRTGLTNRTGKYLNMELAGEAPRFEKGKGSGAKEDPSPASILFPL
ncbi:MAG: hypothetical protein FJY81_00535 [Candidatus Aminicenantes bacterium]|nr:hypothetical protein [Candidatus Aminicenantes bacterium]